MEGDAEKEAPAMASPPPAPAPAPAPASIRDLINAFNDKISLLKQVLIIRSCDTNSVHLANVDIAVRAMEDQLRAVKAHLNEELQAIPKAMELLSLSLAQERRLKHISQNWPSNLPGSDHVNFSDPDPSSYEPESNNGAKGGENVPHKEKKGRGLPPRRYVTVEEFDSLSSYMRGRLTLEKINAAVDEMVTYAEANTRLLGAPRKKLSEDMLEKALELRDFANSDAVKGKHFFLESDMRGPLLKMDTTGKAILTVLRHLGRVSDVRGGKHRALVVLKS